MGTVNNSGLTKERTLGENWKQNIDSVSFQFLSQVEYGLYEYRTSSGKRNNGDRTSQLWTLFVKLLQHTLHLNFRTSTHLPFEERKSVVAVLLTSVKVVDSTVRKTFTKFERQRERRGIKRGDVCTQWAVVPDSAFTEFLKMLQCKRASGTEPTAFRKSGRWRPEERDCKRPSHIHRKHLELTPPWAFAPWNEADAVWHVRENFGRSRPWKRGWWVAKFREDYTLMIND